jgi:DNA-binding transcriptional ArsR family regulator
VKLNILAGVADTDVLTVDKPEQLKALGHPLRLRVLEVLGETRQQLTNRELAARLGVDPGHLHFHVRMLLNAGLIELAETGGRREKPYRAIAPHIRVSRELTRTGAAADTLAVMLESVQEGWTTHSADGNFRSVQGTFRLSTDQVRQMFRNFVAEAEKLEDPSNELQLITIFSHPHSRGGGSGR